MVKQYDKEFKIEAVQLASEPGNTQALVQRELGIGQGVISRWKRELKADSEHAFPGKSHLKPPDDELLRLCSYSLIGYRQCCFEISRCRKIKKGGCFEYSAAFRTLQSYP